MQCRCTVAWNVVDHRVVKTFVLNCILLKNKTPDGVRPPPTAVWICFYLWGGIVVINVVAFMANSGPSSTPNGLLTRSALNEIGCHYFLYPSSGWHDIGFICHHVPAIVNLFLTLGLNICCAAWLVAERQNPVYISIRGWTVQVIRRKPVFLPARICNRSVWFGGCNWDQHWYLCDVITCGGECHSLYKAKHG